MKHQTKDQYKKMIFDFIMLIDDEQALNVIYCFLRKIFEILK